MITKNTKTYTIYTTIGCKGCKQHVGQHVAGMSICYPKSDMEYWNMMAWTLFFQKSSSNIMTIVQCLTTSLRNRGTAVFRCTTKHWTKNSLAWTMESLAPCCRGYLPPPENQDIPTESWWDWKMIHFPLRWPRSRGHSTIFEGCTPKTNMDTQNDALERVNSLLHKAIFGVFVKFLGCRQCRPSKFLSCLK